MPTSLVVAVIFEYLKQAASPHKDEARRYLKDKLSGWKERLALAVFDVAWDIAFASFSKAPHLTVAQLLVEADKEASA